MERSRTMHQRSFPQVSLPMANGARGIEVILIAQLAPGAGDAVAVGANHRQRQHPAHHDALDEPSALLSAPDFDNNDPASLHSFSVGRNGHPFHRHAGARLFTAISGSGGCLLRFSTATPSQLDDESVSFINRLHHVEVPADCLFSVRMSSNIWHQFLPLRTRGNHPALFAVSCHPDEATGGLAATVDEAVHHGHASIADLTELLPAAVQQLLDSANGQKPAITTTRLQLDAHRWSTCRWLCAHLRHYSGRLCQWLTTLQLPGPTAALSVNRRLDIEVGAPIPAESLLEGQLSDQHHSQDVVRVVLDRQQLGNSSASGILGDVLQAFIEHPSSAISGLMRLRNSLVKPLGLRTSPLGCPVSSLLDTTAQQRFANRFPVLAQRSDATHAQVLLGADDRHLQFRSCVAVHVVGEQIQITLATRVRCRNLFGRLYMALIDLPHRYYIAPKMLRTTVTRVLEQNAATQAFVGRPSFR